jgi:hypothetical protein
MCNKICVIWKIICLFGKLQLDYPDEIINNTGFRSIPNKLKRLYIFNIILFNLPP